MITKRFIWKKQINSIEYRCYFVVDNDIACFYLTTSNGLHIRRDGSIDYKDVVLHSDKECIIIDYLQGKLK